MKKDFDSKIVRPFGLEFVEAVPQAELDKISGGAGPGHGNGNGNQVHTLALSLSSNGSKDNMHYDEF